MCISGSFDRVGFGGRDQHEGLRTAEFGRILRGLADDGLGGSQHAKTVVQATITVIVAQAERLLVCLRLR